MRENILYKLKAVVKFGDSLSGLIDAGTVNGVKATTENENGSLSFDYREDTTDYIKKRVAKIAFSIANINFENLQKLSGTDYFTSVPGTRIPDAEMNISSVEADTFYKIENQNSDKSLIVGTVEGLVKGDDYYILKDGAGDSGVVFVSPGSSIKILYEYTPSEKKIFEYGGVNSVSTIEPKIVQIVGTDESGKNITITANYAKLTSGMEFSFPAFTADEYMQIPVEFDCTSDPNDTTKPVLKIESEM